MKRIIITEVHLHENPLLVLIGAKVGMEMQYEFVSSKKSTSNESTTDEGGEGDGEDGDGNGGNHPPKKGGN